SIRCAIGKETDDNIAGNGEGKPARRHRVDADYSAGGVGQRSARISWRKTHIRLHPRLRAKAPYWADSVNHACRKRSHEAQRIANGDGELTRTYARGIANFRRLQPRRSEL